MRANKLGSRIQSESIQIMRVENKLKVFLIEDGCQIRSILIEFLQRTEHIEIIGFAENESDALDQLRSKEWDVVIVDIGLNEGSGLGVLAGLQHDPWKHGKRFVFTNSPSPALKSRCIALGADEFFDKSRDLNMLVNRLQAMLT
jgi:two-component system OmpR family response regulator